MRFISSLLLCLLLSHLALLAQTKSILESKGDLVFGDEHERIVANKFLDGENRLLLVGKKTIRVLDVLNAKFTETRSIDLPEGYEDKPRLISPDGRRMIVFGNYDSRRKEDKIKRPPSVWDLQTGKQIAVLERATKPIRAALWSKNGKTLATSSDRYAPHFADSTSIDVSFWDGETFTYKNSLPSNDASWWHLTEDGSACLYSASTVKNLIIDKWVRSTGPINVWDIGAGKITQTISANDGNIERKISVIQISPDGRLLFFVAQPPKSKNTERRLIVWEIVKGNSSASELKPKYELKPNPQIYEYGGSFSDDGKYFAMDAGKTFQIYETQTGEKKFELPDTHYPRYWLSDDQIFLSESSAKLEAFETATGKQLYQQPIIYSAYEDTSISSYTSTGPEWGPSHTVVTDETKVVPHPSSKMFLTYSNQYVKVFDSQTGELLQTLVSPPMDYSKKKPRLSDKPLVTEAGWSGDGRSLYVISADARTISLWRLLGN